MKNIKRLLSAIVLSCTLFTPVKVFADMLPSLKVIEESKNNINLKVEDTNTVIKSFQITIKVEGVIVNSINWSEKIRDNANADFTLNNGEVTIYVTSRVNLLDEEGTLDIGTLNIKGNDGDVYSIKASNLKLVSINNKSIKADSVNYEGADSFSAVAEENEELTPDNPKEDEDLSEDEVTDSNDKIENTPDNKEDNNNDNVYENNSNESENIVDSKGENIHAGISKTGESVMFYSALCGSVIGSLGIVLFRKKDGKSK